VPRENLSKYEWIREPSVQPPPPSFTEKEKAECIYLTCDNLQKRKLKSRNPTNFWISVNEYTALVKKDRCEWLSLSDAKQDFLPTP